MSWPGGAYAATTTASRSVVISSLHLEGHVWKPFFALNTRVPGGIRISHQAASPRIAYLLVRDTKAILAAAPSSDGADPRLDERQGASLESRLSLMTMP